MFSYFKKPITNKYPYKTISLDDVHKVIKGDYFKERTLKGLEIKENEGKEAFRKYKATAFDYVTFAGVFEERCESGLVKPSGLMCLDIDHEKNIESLRRNLIKDTFLNLKLIFRSPSYEGLKLVIRNPNPEISYKDSYQKVSDYVFRKYGRRIDATSDKSRACFVGHDMSVYFYKRNIYKLDNEIS